MGKKTLPDKDMRKADVLLEPGGNIVCFDNDFPHFWKISLPSGAAGKNIAQFFNDHDRFPDIMEKILSSGSWSGELKGLDENHLRFPVKVECILISNNRGEPLYITCKCSPEIIRPVPGPEEEKVLRGKTMKKTVMLVDDDDLVRVVIHSMLEDTGYHVISSDSGRTALKISEAYGGDIDVLVTDVLMPGMNGKELARSLEKSRPGVKVVFISGHHDGIIDTSLEKNTRSPFLRKPFTAEMLSDAVQGVLGGEPPS